MQISMSEDEDSAGYKPTPLSADIEEDICIRCLKTGKIIVVETQSTFHCVIRRLCWLTAQLHMKHYVELPSEFLLSLGDVDYSDPIKCRITARTGTTVDVTFIE